MSHRFKDTDSIVDAAIAQMTPAMQHICILPSTVYVKITRVVNVVRSETLLRADEGPGCPPGSQDLQAPPSHGDACEPAPTHRPPPTPTPTHARPHEPAPAYGPAPTPGGPREPAPTYTPTPTHAGPHEPAPTHGPPPTAIPTRRA